MPISGAAVGSLATTSSPWDAGGGNGTMSAGGCTSTSSCGAAAGAKQVITIIRQLLQKTQQYKCYKFIFTILFLNFNLFINDK